MIKFRKIIYFLFLLCLSVSYSQNLLFQNNEKLKREGLKFERLDEVLKKTTKKKDLIQEFKDTKKVSFFEYNKEVYDKLPRTFSFELQLNDGNIMLELEAVDNDFYSYVVTTDKGEVFPAMRSIKHYRGIIANDKNSIVALSFSEESVNGIVANAKGNFNLSSINDTNAIVYFKDDNTIYENTFSCGEFPEEFDSDIVNETYSNTLSEKLNLDSFKCLRIYFELRYDMYQRYGATHSPGIYDGTSMSKTVGYFTSVFNQVSALFYNAGINAYISELKVNTQPDIYLLYQGTLQNGCYKLDSEESLNIHSQFGNNLTSNYNGDIAQLISVKKGTSYGNGRLMKGYPYQNYSLCSIPKKLLYSYANIGDETCVNSNNHFSNYSWNINVIIHELGHDLGSNHTQSCVWNGNNTPIDNCGPVYYTNNPNPFGAIDGQNCFNPSNPILPYDNGGTIMSYCHLLNTVKIKFSNGFGESGLDNPLTRIRSKICADYQCEAKYCFYDIHIGSETGGTNGYNGDYTVPNGSVDNRSVANNIYAYNNIESGGSATYLAGKSIYLGSVAGGSLNYRGFHAKAGSNVTLKIESCESMQYIVPRSYENKVNDIENRSLDSDGEKLTVSLYPNPTSGLITIESNQEIIFWELTDEIGKVNKSGKIDNLKIVELDFSNLNYGIYNIKIHLSNGEFSYKKMIKR